MNINRQIILFSLAFFLLNSFCYTFAQKKKYGFQYFEGNYKKMFVEAESFFHYEDYNEALYLYRLLKKKFQEHHGIQYRIGQCLLELPYNKDKSVEAFEKIKHFSSKECEEFTFKHSCVPQDVYYFLGDAYRINEQLDKAIEAYEHFIAICDTTLYDITLSEEQIRACKNAKHAIQNPISLKINPLSDNINDNYPNTNPVVSGNDSVLVFTTKLKFYDAVYFSTKNDSGWNAPVNIIPQLEVDDNTYPTALSYDGKYLLLIRNEDYKSDICCSYYKDGRWTPIEKLNNNINTKYWESHACITKDNQKLYFTSNREGGFGGLDIYKSVKDENKEWGEAINLGNIVNTKYNEQTPFITSDGKKLYFSSYGHHNIGGYDIFIAEKKGPEQWNKPVNIGYPVNTPDDNLFFVPHQNGKTGYYSFYSKSKKHKKEDIYIITINANQNTR